MITKRVAKFALGAFALVAAVACTPQEDPVGPTAVEAVVESIVASEVTPTSAKATVKFKDASEVLFAYYPTSEAANEPAWKSISVISSQTEIVETLSNLTPGIEYTLEAYALNSDEKESASVTTTFTTIEGPTVTLVNEILVSESTASQEVELANGDQVLYHYYKAGEAPVDPEWTEAAIETPIVVELTGLTPGTEYELVIKALNTVEGIESAEVKVMFSTVASIVQVVEDRISALNIQIDINFDSERAQLWAYQFTDGQFAHIDDFKSGITSGNSNIKYTVVADTTLNLNMLSPTFNYVLFAVPLNVSSDGKYELVEEPAQYNYTTPALTTFGQGTETLNLEASEVTINSAKVTVTRGSENVDGFLSGHVAKSELEGTTLNDWIIDTEWLKNAQRTQLFYTGMDGTVTYEESSNKWFNDLSYGTEYTFFALAIDKDGRISNPSTTNATTVAVNFDESLTINVAHTGSGILDANFDVTFAAGIDKFIYVNSEAVLDPENTWKFKTPEQAQTELINKAFNQSQGVKSDDPSIVANVYDLKMESLEENKAYRLYYCAVAADGTLGKIETIEYSTNALSFGSTAAVAYTFVSAEETQAEFFGELMFDGYKITLDVTMSGGATEFVIGALNKGYVQEQTVESYAKYLLLVNPWGLESFTASGEVTPQQNKIFSDTDLLVIIPVDATGNYGTPITYEYDGWPEVAN